MLISRFEAQKIRQQARRPPLKLTFHPSCSDTCHRLSEPRKIRMIVLYDMNPLITYLPRRSRSISPR
ncbi:hypothetical protein PAXRUDRAFT_664375 [Paxillus rubicundulus Ve08.2h10]|uniref:Uncharacterized protein n=1 Tax=Paxillus rubicundulus Ve08.2h10 TaxID=930991 RepID=A0A0D0DJK0_9AGAM|nr:hypothetical protein PAXRUDRAFT_664375 [Paxillus rubicundulus Ve08.2h10]